MKIKNSFILVLLAITLCCEVFCQLDTLVTIPFLHIQRARAMLRAKILEQRARQQMHLIAARNANRRHHLQRSITSEENSEFLNEKVLSLGHSDDVEKKNLDDEMVGRPLTKDLKEGSNLRFAFFPVDDSSESQPRSSSDEESVKTFVFFPNHEDWEGETPKGSAREADSSKFLFYPNSDNRRSTKQREEQFLQNLWATSQFGKGSLEPFVRSSFKKDKPKLTKHSPDILDQTGDKNREADPHLHKHLHGHSHDHFHGASYPQSGIIQTSGFIPVSYQTIFPATEHFSHQHINQHVNQLINHHGIINSNINQVPGVLHHGSGASILPAISISNGINSQIANVHGSHNILDQTQSISNVNKGFGIPLTTNTIGVIPNFRGNTQTATVSGNANAITQNQILGLGKNDSLLDSIATLTHQQLPIPNINSVFNLSSNPNLQWNEEAGLSKLRKVIGENLDTFNSRLQQIYDEAFDDSRLNPELVQFMHKDDDLSPEEQKRAEAIEMLNQRSYLHYRPPIKLNKNKYLQPYTSDSYSESTPGDYEARNAAGRKHQHPLKIHKKHPSFKTPPKKGHSWHQKKQKHHFGRESDIEQDFIHACGENTGDDSGTENLHPFLNPPRQQELEAEHQKQSKTLPKQAASGNRELEFKHDVCPIRKAPHAIESKRNGEAHQERQHESIKSNNREYPDAHDRDQKLSHHTSETSQSKSTPPMENQPNRNPDELLGAPYLFEIPYRRSLGEPLDFSRKSKRSTLSTEAVEKAREHFQKVLKKQRQLVDTLKRDAIHDSDLLMISYIGDTIVKDFERKNKNMQEKMKKRSVPLLRLVADRRVKLDVPKTLENIGTVTKKSFEDERAPMYHVKNLVGSAKNMMLSAMRIPPQNLVIPSQYEIVKLPENQQQEGILGSINRPILNRVSSRTKARTDERREKKDPITKKSPILETFERLGGIIRESVQSGQDTLKHLGDVAYDARNVIHTTKYAVPKIVVPYSRAAVVQRADKKKPLNPVLITPRFYDITENKLSSPDPSEDRFVKLGHLFDAFGISNPDAPRVPLQRIILPRARISNNNLRQTPKVPTVTKLSSRFGEPLLGSTSILKTGDTISLLSDKSPLMAPRYQMGEYEEEPPQLSSRFSDRITEMKAHTLGNSDMSTIGDTIDTLHNAKVSIGAKTLRDFLIRMKNELTALSKDVKRERESRRQMKANTLPPAQKKHHLGRKKLESRKQNQLDAKTGGKQTKDDGIVGFLDKLLTVRPKATTTRKSKAKSKPDKHQNNAGKNETSTTNDTKRIQSPKHTEQAQLKLRQNKTDALIKHLQDQNLIPDFPQKQNDTKEVVGAGLFLTPDLLHPFMGRASKNEMREFMRETNVEDSMSSEARAANSSGAASGKNSSEGASSKNSSEAASDKNSSAASKMENRTSTVKDIIKTDGASEKLFSVRDEGKSVNNTVGTSMTIAKVYRKPFMGSATKTAIKDLIHSYNSDESFSSEELNNEGIRQETVIYPGPNIQDLYQ